MFLVQSCVIVELLKLYQDFLIIPTNSFSIKNFNKS